MDNITSSSLRYAKALFNAVKKKGLKKEIFFSLIEIAKILSPDTKIFKTLINPAVSLNIKEETIKILAKELNLDEILLNFLNLLLQKHRLGEINNIIFSYQKLMDEEEGIVRAEIKTAFPLLDEEREELILQLEKLYNSKIIADIKVDKNLIYGIVIKIGDKIIDGSFKTYLLSLKKQLTLRR